MNQRINSKAVSSHQEMILDGLCFVVNDNNADILKCCTGGLNRLTIWAGGHDCMRVPVNQEINTVYVIIKIERTISIGCRLIINTKMDKAEDQVDFLLSESVDSDLSACIQIIKGCKRDL